MHIVIFSHYINGSADLNFGRKLAAMIREEYPAADIQLVTSLSSLLERKKGIDDLALFNKNSSFPALPIDHYLKANKKADIIMLGPDLNFVVSRIEEIVAMKNTPVLIFTEYDVSTRLADNLTRELNLAGFSTVVLMPSGLGEGRGGIFIERHASEFFDKGRFDQGEPILRQGLPIIGRTILQGQSPKDYLENTTIVVSDCHNTALRLLEVHKEITLNNRNMDVIFGGEEGNKEVIISTLLRSPTLIDKGFSKIIYQTPNSEPEIILEQGKEAEGPLYRIIHADSLPHEEMMNLRKISDIFSAASGDASYSEAISTSNIIIYECQAWKKELVSGMQAIANKTDPSGDLARAMYLLATASTEVEYKELSDLINSSGMKKKFSDYRDSVLDNKDLSVQFKIVLSNLVGVVQLNQEKVTKSVLTGRAIYLGLRNTLFGKGVVEGVHEMDTQDSDMNTQNSIIDEEPSPTDSKKSLP